MDLNTYQRAAARTLGGTSWPWHTHAANAALGIAGEAGEVADMHKKYLFHGHDLDRDELIKELGDVLWYLAALATLHNLDLDDIAQANIDKLWTRYPNGFSAEDSQRRADER